MMRPRDGVLFLIWCFIFAPSMAHSFQVNFTPRASVSEEYTDNLFRAPEEEAEHDFITVASAGFTIEARGRESGLSLGFDPAYSAYMRFTGGAAWRQDVDFTAWTESASRTRLEFNNRYLRTEDPLAGENPALVEADEPLEPSESAIRRGRQPYFTNRTSVGLTRQFGANNSISAGYAYGILENEDPEIEDSAEHTPSAEFEYWFNPRMGMTAAGEYARSDFEWSENFERWGGAIRLIRRFSRRLEVFAGYNHEYMDYFGAGEDYQVYSPAIGGSYTFSDNDSMICGLGYFYTDLELGGTITGLTANVDFQKSFQWGSTRLSGMTGYNQSYFGAENLGFTIYYQIGADVGYEITRDLGARLQGSFRNVDYKEVEPERNDKLFRLGVGFDWRPLQWLTVQLDYVYDEVNSSEDANDLSENQVRLMLRATPTTPYRLLD
ncbi:MAG: outer membrane beta-barrel protein [Desulfobacterales bacterium]|nr:outer membrane beta-barrel protein [Desulfobacterales bacterium]